MHRFIELFFLIICTIYTPCLFAQDNRPSEKEVLLERQIIEAAREKILGNYAEAITLYEAIIKKDNSNHYALYECSRLYKELEQYEDAVIQIEKALSLEEEELYYNWYLQLLEQQGNYKKAAEWFEQRVKKEADNAFLYDEWIRLLEKNKNYEKLPKVFKLVEKNIGPTENLSLAKIRYYQQQGKGKKVLSEISTLLKKDAKNERYLLLKADYYKNNNLEEQARVVYREILAINPNNSQANIAIVEEYLQKGDTVKYLAVVKTVIGQKSTTEQYKTKLLQVVMQSNSTVKYKAELLDIVSILKEYHPNSTAARSWHIELLSMNNRHEALIPIYQKELKKNPNQLVYWERLLKALAKRFQFDDLEKEGLKMLDYYPNQGVAYYYLGLAYFKKGNWGKALSILKEGADVSFGQLERYAAIQQLLGNVYFEQKNYVKAKECFEEAINSGDKNIEIISDYCFVLLIEGKSSSKLKELMNHLEQHAAQSPYLSYLKAYQYFLEKKQAKAAQEMQRITRENLQASARMQECYGDILYQTGEREQAIKYWNQAKLMGANSKRIEQKINQ